MARVVKLAGNDSGRLGGSVIQSRFYMLAVDKPREAGLSSFSVRREELGREASARL
jgi:hypothetical protein